MLSGQRPSDLFSQVMNTFDLRQSMNSMPQPYRESLRVNAV